MKMNMPLRVAVMVIALFVIGQGLCLAGLMTLKGSSMEPTIKDGSKVWVSKYAKGAYPARGDIVVFSAEKTVFVRRVIGLPGEQVIIREGAVFIVHPENPVEEKLVEPYLAPGTTTEPDGAFSVPHGRYFVLADKRGASKDSRAIGCIPGESIIGRVTKVF